MKLTILILCIFLSLTSCSDDEAKSQENNFLGTWKLIETYGSDGGSNSQWTSVDNGYTYTFNNNGTFSSTRFTECTTGTYGVSSNSITLVYGCEGFDTGIENPAGTFVENYVFEDENIILTPTYMNCDEGCSYKFEKVE
ncbi:hypothetical protein [Pseudotamlana carrageenivorans]|uniref:Lipocalin-like domain-containing protein n=1 Tax=Pseudotamlana carrageenivorans TaxID=2069432 RepID=A0A2I7SME6_9FLAO|nr:hypothetical protein [Tamlana carrageenivorans]AUS07068.1 hypothetical protein C1A40_17185 [Tamlana carrageenivorans]